MTLPASPHRSGTSPRSCEPTSALLSGAVCAVAGQSQRQMREWASRYPRVYGAETFDPALFSTLALAAAFSGPGLSADELRMANRVCLWAFGLDLLVDHVLRSAAEVRDLARRCVAIAAGARPDEDDELGLFLADLRDELADAPAFARLGGVWRDDFERMLAGMLREWEWKSGAAGRPSFEEYLGNADNLGFSFVLTAHWITRGGGGDPGAVRAASSAVQRVVRLLNDVRSLERDREWGDMNALLLEVAPSEVERRTAELTATARGLLDALRADGGAGELADYMERQMDFCAGFYRVSDFWGSM